MINFDELAKNYLEILDDLLEKSEDFEVNSFDELVEKFNDYGRFCTIQIGKETKRKGV